jgi:uncharacterized DUF497 family protein
MDNIYTFDRIDVRFELRGQLFEWNAGKASANLLKHRIRFEAACQVFFDPFVRVVRAGEVHPPRWAALGATEDWSILFVVYVVRQDSLRIVSARRATPSERRSYEHQ